MTLPYPCDAEVCLVLKDSVEETVEEYCDVAESKQITESESKSKCRTKKRCTESFLYNDRCFFQTDLYAFRYGLMPILGGFDDVFRFSCSQICKQLIQIGIAFRGRIFCNSLCFQHSGSWLSRKTSCNGSTMMPNARCRSMALSSRMWMASCGQHRKRSRCRNGKLRKFSSQSADSSNNICYN